MEKLHMILPYFPPPLNRAYVSVQGRKILSRESRTFKSQSIGYLSTTYLEDISQFVSEHKGKTFTLVIRLYSRWKAANGNLIKRDISNYVKLIEDVIAEVLGIDDKYNVRVVVDKIHTLESEYVEIYYYPQELQICDKT